MYIEMLSEKTLKVELIFEDMQKLNIDRNCFLYKDLAAKRALKTILKNAYEQTGFDVFNAKLTVEIFPTENDGCMIIFTKITPKKFKATAMKQKSVFVFASIDDLIDCLKIILHKESLFDSCVYKFNNNYYLALDNRLMFDKSVLIVINEFSTAKSNLSKNHLEEYGEIIFKKL